MDSLFKLESYARVHHLVSTVRGQLAEGEDALSLIRACFPGGSITGAPKLRSMEIIEELEPHRRGIYCGSIGYVGFDGDMDRAVELCERALNLNPYAKYNYNLGIARFAARDYRRAVELTDSIGDPPAQVLALLAASQAMAGEVERATASLARFHEAAAACPVFAGLDGPEDWRTYFSQRWPFREAEDTAHLLKALGKAGFPL